MRAPHRRRDDCSVSCPLSGLPTTNRHANGTCDALDCLAEVHFKRGDLIYAANDAAAHVYCIRTGAVKLLRDSGAGRRRIVRLVKRDGIIGMERLFSPTVQHSAIAMADVTACRCAVSDLRKLVRAEPSVQLRLLEHYQDLLSETESWLSEMVSGDTRIHERVARALMHLRDGESQRIYRFSVADISALLGITIETASRHLAEMKRLGLLESRTRQSNHYTADIAGLEEIAYRTGARAS